MRLAHIATTVALASLIPASARAAEMLTNGGFENEPNFGSGFANDGGFSGFTGTQIPGWTIADRHGVTVHNTVAYPHISGNYSVNMDGEGLNGVNADFSQSFATGLGTPYTVDYDYQGWTSSTLQLFVTVTDLTTSTVLYSDTENWTAALTHVSGGFAGTGNPVSFRVFETTSGFNDNSIMVDNFSVQSVPEAASMAPLSTGLLLLKRRRR